MALNEKQTTNQRGTTMEQMIKLLTKNGFSRSVAKMMAKDINLSLGLMETFGSMKEEAVIGFYYAAKKRGLGGDYVKAVITIAKKLYSANH